MITDWNAIPDTLQSYLADEAFRKAATMICGHAEILAEEFESGALADRGGAETLRLMAAVVRALAPKAEHAAGRA